MRIGLFLLTAALVMLLGLALWNPAASISPEWDQPAPTPSTVFSPLG